jgi:hypothetical protein
MLTLLFSLALVASPMSIPSKTSGDIDHFIVSAERCELWRARLKDGPSPPIEQAAMKEACDPLPGRLSELRTTYANDPAAQLLGPYDNTTGMPTRPLPTDVTALISRLDQCAFLGGELNGDGSDEDKANQRRQEKLDCGDDLHDDLQKLRQHYRQDIRISWRLSRYDSDDAPLSLVPEDVEAFEATSLACRKQPRHDAACTELPHIFTRLQTEYANNPPLEEGFSAYCVWDDRHCYDPASGLPVHAFYRTDSRGGRLLKDPATGKEVISISPRDGEDGT